MFMAACFCAYVHNNKKLEILSKLDYTNEQLQQTFFKNVDTVAKMMNIKAIINQTEQSDFYGNIRTKSEDDSLLYHDLQSKKNESNEFDWEMYMPILT